MREYKESALILAGGTFIHGLVARGLLTDVDALIDINQLALNYVNTESKQVAIGATTTFRDLEGADVLQLPLLGSLKDALSYPPTQVKNAATLGGSIAASCPFFDIPVALLALDARVMALGPDGESEIALEQFFISLFENGLSDNEFVTAVKIPVEEPHTSSAFSKVETNANDLAILNVAVRISILQGECAGARIFVGGGVGETPARIPSAESVLIGQVIDETVIARAGELARENISPMSDHRASAAYRKYMASVMVVRTLRKAIDRIPESGAQR